MSSALAYSLPVETRRGDHDSHPRHIQIVTSSSQRRARPKVFYAIVAIAGLFALFIAQLLMSIVISDGAYQISHLNSQQRQLDREQQALTEQLNLLSSPQNLATRAESLGMILSTTTPVFLSLADGTVVGREGVGAQGSALLGSSGSLVPNALLSELPAAATTTKAAITTDSSTGAPALAPASSAVTSTLDSLPAPVTR
jgi:cell division protein FtsL